MCVTNHHKNIWDLAIRGNNSMSIRKKIKSKVEWHNLWIPQLKANLLKQNVME